MCGNYVDELKKFAVRIVRTDGEKNASQISNRKRHYGLLLPSRIGFLGEIIGRPGKAGIFG